MPRGRMAGGPATVITPSDIFYLRNYFMPLDQRKIEILNALSQMRPGIAQTRPEMPVMVREFVDDLRLRYPEVSDDDLASLIMDTATGMSYILATAGARQLPMSVNMMITFWGQAAVELSRLTRADI